MRQLIKLAGRETRVTGRMLRIAQLEGDGYEFLDDPVPMVEALRRCGIRIDLFTFTQRLPERSAKYSYPCEWNDFPVVLISTYDHWRSLRQ